MLHRSIVLCVAVGFIVTLAGKAYSGSIDGSTIEVSGLANPGNPPRVHITVTLREIIATNPSDVDVVVVGPTGVALVLLGGAGGTTPVNALNITFDDTASIRVPTNGLNSGSFQPTQDVPIGSFPSPGPGLAYDSPAVIGTSTLGNPNEVGVFSNANPNGTWSLYAMDTVSGDSTDIAGGWSVNIDISGTGNFSVFTNSTPIVIPGPSTVPEPGTLTLALFGIAGMAGFRLRGRLQGNTKRGAGVASRNPGHPTA